jgi:hypothetical protein
MLYATLLDENLDADALHQLLVEKGPSLLDAQIPYLVVAARNRNRSVDRRDRRRAVLEERLIESDTVLKPFVNDPADLVVERAELDDAMVVLGSLDARYSWPLWWHAAGFSDDEIIELWNDAGFEPPNPSAAAIRKRRERARLVLRQRLHTESTDSS